MSDLKALIFDVDGTLADTERDGHRVAFNRAFAEAGLDWDWTVELYGKLLAVSGGKERIRYFCDQFLPGFEVDGHWDDFVAGLHWEKTRHYLQLLEQGAIPLRPGVQRLLEDAHSAGLTLAIATTTTPENVTSLLRATLGDDAIKRFAVIAAGDVVPAKKPSPDIYHYALERLGLTAAECLAFEDSDNGIDASSAAGIKTVVTVNDYTRDQDFSAAVLVVDQLGEPGNPCQVLSGGADLSIIDLAAINRLWRL